MKQQTHTRIAALAVATLAIATPESLRAEQLNLDRTAAGFTAEIDQHLAAAEASLRRLLNVKGPRTVANTVRIANEMYIHLDTANELTSLFANTHPDKTVRTAAEVAQRKVSGYLSDLGLNRDLFDAYSAVDLADADADTNRLMFTTLRDFRHAGVDRDEATRARLRTLNEKTVELSQTFGKNIREDVRSIKLTSPADLAGLPQDYIQAHAPDAGGTITITTDYPDYNPFMAYARNADARRALYKAFRTRGYPKNIKVLDALLDARAELAGILGYNNWAQYITEDKMIMNDRAAADFIDRIAKLAKAPSDADMAMLLEAKRHDDPQATRIFDYETAYYTERVKTTQYNFDSQEARDYFEFNRVQKGLFDVTSRLFGVQFRPVKNVTLWHSDVTAWDMFDGDKHIGRFMLDLHPRPGKYKHAACFGYQTGIEGKQIPISVLVCNFPNPKTTSGPALMEQKDVTTFFHEFGHLLHALFAGHHDWIGISGIATEWDFVEAPSQMLEEWTWDTTVLQMFAKHSETGEPIPAELVQRMRAARDLGKGMWVMQQMFYASISLNFHNRAPETFDTTALLKKLAKRYAPCDHVDGTYMQCSFGHLTGYSAIYYTYMWSMVIAKDMFSAFETAGIFDPATAQRYRHTVLEAGGSKPAADLVKDFLGRGQSFAAYAKWLKRKSTPPS